MGVQHAFGREIIDDRDEEMRESWHAYSERGRASFQEHPGTYLP